MNQAEEMQALEEFWKPVVPVPQRNNSKRKVHCFFLSFSLFSPSCIYCDDNMSTRVSHVVG
jgi:hypothetical protein